MSGYLDAAIRRCALPINGNFTDDCDDWYGPNLFVFQRRDRLSPILIANTPAEARTAYLALVAQFEAGERSGR